MQVWAKQLMCIILFNPRAFRQPRQNSKKRSFVFFVIGSRIDRQRSGNHREETVRIYVVKNDFQEFEESFPKRKTVLIKLQETH